MNEKAKVIFIAMCFVMCLIPSAGMIFSASEETIGNERTVSAPRAVKDDGTFNTDLLGDAGNYFEHHYALRPEMITADAKLQNGLFGVSNTDTVVTGTDGWLYYSSTLKDYRGEEPLSERGLWSLAHNISILQAYAEGQGAKFLFAVPPNKNSLYGENMPYYYSVPVSEKHDRDSLAAALEEQDCHYTDLFGLFSGQAEVLYLKEDSHWNNRGAALVSDEILSALGKNHTSFFEAPASRTKSHDGDLRAMIYPAEKQAEYDYTYETDRGYEYIVNSRTLGDEVSVEDLLVLTEAPEASGRLLMYRDSFANTLIPFLSGEFSYGAYSKAVPGRLASDLEEYHPDYVVVEKAERNIRDLLTSPYIVPAPEVRKSDMEGKLRETVPATWKSEPCKADPSFLVISGTLSGEDADRDTRIYAEVGSGGEARLYEAFTTVIDGDDNGFLLYLDPETAGDGPVSFYITDP